MLKYLQENLSVGCFVEVESPDGTVQGSISAIQPDHLELLTDGQRHQYSEAHLLGVKYISDENDASFVSEARECKVFHGNNFTAKSIQRVSGFRKLLIDIS